MSCVTCQDPSYLANILTNTNRLLMLNFGHLANIMTNINNIRKVYLCYLANALTNTNSISKLEPCHLANTLTNIYDKVNNFIREEMWLRLTDYSLLVTK